MTDPREGCCLLRGWTGGLSLPSVPAGAREGRRQPPGSPVNTSWNPVGTVAPHPPFPWATREGRVRSLKSFATHSAANPPSIQVWDPEDTPGEEGDPPPHTHTCRGRGLFHLRTPGPSILQTTPGQTDPLLPFLGML